MKKIFDFKIFVLSAFKVLAGKTAPMPCLGGLKGQFRSSLKLLFFLHQIVSDERCLRCDRIWSHFLLVVPVEIDPFLYCIHHSGGLQLSLMPSVADPDPSCKFWQKTFKLS